MACPNEDPGADEKVSAVRSQKDKLTYILADRDQHFSPSTAPPSSLNGEISVACELRQRTQIDFSSQTSSGVCDQNQAETKQAGTSHLAVELDLRAHEQSMEQHMGMRQLSHESNNGHVFWPGDFERWMLSSPQGIEALGDAGGLDELAQNMTIPAVSGLRRETMMTSSQGWAWASLFSVLNQRCDMVKKAEWLSLVTRLTQDDDADKPAPLSNLAHTYRSAFEAFGWHDDLTKAVIYYDQAVAFTPDGHPNVPGWLSNLGNAYLMLFETFGGQEDLTKGVDYHSRVVALTPDDHPHKSCDLNNLGSYYGSHNDLSKAVSYQSQAIVLTPDDHPKKFCRLDNIGSGYRWLFETFGGHNDLTKMVDYHIQAVASTPDGHPRTPGRLNNLGSAYKLLFETYGRHDDLSKVVDCHTQAVRLTPNSHPHMPGHLSSLRNAYKLLFKRYGKHNNFAKAVKYYSQAVVPTSDNHPQNSCHLNRLGTSYKQLFKTLGRHDDFSKAISYHSQVASLTPDGHPPMPNHLGCLEDAYWLQLEPFGQHENIKSAIGPHGQADSQSYNSLQVTKSLCAFKDAACGRLSVRLQASRTWAKFLCFTEQHSLEAHTRCMQLLCETVWLGGSVHDMFTCLEKHARDLVAESAAAAITARQFDTAIEWLEQGRCMVWTQLLELRMPLDELRDAYPAAADELQRLSLVLEQSPLSSSDEATLDVAQWHRRVAGQREQVIKQIRRLEGFEDFLQPPKTAQLATYVSAHAVIVINVSPKRCDALVMRPDAQSAGSVSLPNFSYQQAIDARLELLDRLKTRDRERGFKKHKMKPEMSIEQVLSALWYKVAQPILCYLGISEVRPIKELPHIVWCVTGALSFLPIHAAGDYTTGDPKTIMHNLVVSSYTPNLSTLGRLVKPAAPFLGILAVGVSSSVRRHAALPMVKREIDNIHRRFEGVQSMRLDDEDAGTDKVLQGMASHSWVHLACHGSQNRMNPLQSAFQLYDAPLDLATISRTKLPHADFAFLSACKTAAGDHDLPDEAVHLAAGLLMAGYRSVIASMWAIYDEYAPEVADSVYEYMLASGRPDSGRAARALHKAMGKLRDKIGVEQYDAWVPYIHMGC